MFDAHCHVCKIGCMRRVYAQYLLAELPLQELPRCALGMQSTTLQEVL